MTLDATTIRTKLDAAGFLGRDDAARAIVEAATAAELKGLDDKGVLLLYHALGAGILSDADAAAIKTLKASTRYQPILATPEFGVRLVRAARPANATVMSELTSGMVTRIYKAEDKRLSRLERIGIDGSTIGRGQLGQDAFSDVIEKRNFQSEWENCVRHYVISTYLAGLRYDPMQCISGGTKVKVPTSYNLVHRFNVLEDFVVAAYLALRMIAATKPGRTTKDTARFAVAIYHGMFKMVSAAQSAVHDTINWAPVEKKLIADGFTDEVAYVNEVVT